jgi:hypothetical protein
MGVGRSRSRSLVARRVCPYMAVCRVVCAEQGCLALPSPARRRSGGSPRPARGPCRRQARHGVLRAHHVPPQHRSRSRRRARRRSAEGRRPHAGRRCRLVAVTAFAPWPSGWPRSPPSRPPARSPSRYTTPPRRRRRGPTRSTGITTRAPRGPRTRLPTGSACREAPEQQKDCSETPSLPTTCPPRVVTSRAGTVRRRLRPRNRDRRAAALRRRERSRTSLRSLTIGAKPVPSPAATAPGCDSPVGARSRYDGVVPKWHAVDRTRVAPRPP